MPEEGDEEDLAPIAMDIDGEEKFSAPAASVVAKVNASGVLIASTPGDAIGA